MSRHFVRILAAISVIGMSGACGSPTDVRPDSGACPQTRGFGSSGCADVEGVVLDQNGEPWSGIIVGPRYLAGHAGFSTSYSTTDADGRFGFRITRYTSEPIGAGPDTISVFVHAADPRSARVGVPAAVRDSVLGQATIARVGSIPVPLEVTIQLQAP